LGTVVPKRHARRSVTRNLLKRGIRTAVSLNSHVLDKGLWVVRLRAPFDKSAFPSAASMSLQAAAALELAQAIRQAAEPARRRRPAAVRHA
jgi:ribonuclease P protein component